MAGLEAYCNGITVPFAGHSSRKKDGAPSLFKDILMDPVSYDMGQTDPLVIP